MSRTAETIPALNGVRGLAALLVLVSHAGHRDVLPNVFGQGAGHMGVMLFFTLSAFLMTYLYFGQQPTRNAVWDYWVARFGRVYPLFIALLTTGYVAHLAGVTRTTYAYAMPLETYLTNAFFIGRFNVFWTISTEFQFYLLFALTWIFAYSRTNPVRVMAVIWLVVSLLVFVDIYPYPSGPVFKTLHFFALGVLAALLLQAGFVSQASRVADGALLILLTAFVASMPAFFVWWAGLAHGGFWSPWLLLLSFSIVWCAAIARGPVSLLLGSRLGGWLGDISFAVYLLHVPILETIQRAMPEASYLAKFSLAATVTLGLATFVYRVYERPMRIWARQKFLTRGAG